MLELQQAYPIGNPRKPYSWSFSSRGKSRECVQPGVGSSGDLRKYRCNNCNIELPIDELRIRESEQAQLSYPNKLERPVLYHEMLLCRFCKYEWREWVQDSSKHYERKTKGPHRGQRSSSELERYYLIPLASWCQAYWRNKIATEDGRVPLSGRQIPPSPEARQASPTPQSLR